MIGKFEPARAGGGLIEVTAARFRFEESGDYLALPPRYRADAQAQDRPLPWPVALAIIFSLSMSLWALIALLVVWALR